MVEFGKKKGSIVVDRLTAILADMLRSALAWEEEHGRPQDDGESGKAKGLTFNPRRIYCSRHGSRMPRLMKGGSDSENVDHS